MLLSFGIFKFFAADKGKLIKSYGVEKYIEELNKHLIFLNDPDEYDPIECGEIYSKITNSLNNIN